MNYVDERKTRPDTRPISSRWRLGRGSNAVGQGQYLERERERERSCPNLPARLARFYANKKKTPRTDGQTDRPTDRQTDRASYRDLRTHLKKYSKCLFNLKFSILSLDNSEVNFTAIAYLRWAVGRHHMNIFLTMSKV